MKKLMKKKVNKKLLIFGLPILALTLVTAGLLTYYGQIQQDVNVVQAVTLKGGDCVDNVCTEDYSGEIIYSGDTLDSEVYKLSNLADTPRVVKLVTSSDPVTDVGEIVTTPIFKLSIPFETAPNLVQDRVVAEANGIDIDTITTLDFEYMLTETTTGYSPYFVLVFDTTGDGEANEWVVSWQDTGMVANTWLTHGNSLNYHNTALCIQSSPCDWTELKTGLPANSKLLQVKVMIGYWGDMTATTVSVKNIEVNGNDLVDNGLVLKGYVNTDELDDTNGDVIVDFYTENYFDTTGFDGIITTEVQPVA